MSTVEVAGRQRLAASLVTFTLAIGDRTTDVSW